MLQSHKNESIDLCFESSLVNLLKVEITKDSHHRDWFQLSLVI